MLHQTKTCSAAFLLMLIWAPLFAADTPQAERVKDTAYFLDRLAGEDAWLSPLDDEHAYLASSHQPQAKRDCNAFLRTEREGDREWKVLLDVEGPGVITRFWTAGDFDGALELHIDGTPVVQTTLRQLFGGMTPPFRPPLVVDHTESSGGRVSYFPIPFRKGAKIRSDATSGSFYWQIHYSLLGSSSVQSFSPSLSEGERSALERAEERFRSGPPQGSPYRAVAGMLKPGRNRILSLDGRGKIPWLSFSLEKGAAEDLCVEVYYGNARTPSIQAGFLDLFHLGSKARSFQSAYALCDKENFALKMPLPFSDGIRIDLVQRDGAVARRYAAAIGYAEECGTDLRLHAVTTRARPKHGELLTLLDLEGRGVFVGLNLTTQAPQAIGTEYFNQEGNEYIWVDGAREPIWRGTGTEDYFNCGYYYRNGEVALPLHGCLDKRPIEGGRISAYRIHKLDAVPFRKGITVRLEAGCPKKGGARNGTVELDYRWTAFWFAPVAEE